MAFIPRNTAFSTGMRKIDASMMKRIGRGHAAEITIGSTKLTWLQMSSAGPRSGMRSMPVTRSR